MCREKEGKINVLAPGGVNSRISSNIPLVRGGIWGTVPGPPVPVKLAKTLHHTGPDRIQMDIAALNQPGKLTDLTLKIYLMIPG